MKELHIDIETFATVDLNKTGVYRYVEDPKFQILLFGVSVDGGPVLVYDLTKGQKLSKHIMDALLDERVFKYAHNASFERVCLYLVYQPGGRLWQEQPLQRVSVHFLQSSCNLYKGNDRVPRMEFPAAR